MELTLIKLDTEMALDVISVFDAASGEQLGSDLSGSAPDLPRVVAVGVRSSDCEDAVRADPKPPSLLQIKSRLMC